MTRPEVDTALTAAALAEDQATAGEAIEVLLRFLGLFPDVYGFLYGKLRAARLDLSTQGSPAEIADAIRAAVRSGQELAA
jgi:hypothetical protein